MFEIFLDKTSGGLWNYHFWESKTLDKPLVLKDNGKEAGMQDKVWMTGHALISLLPLLAWKFWYGAVSFSSRTHDQITMARQKLVLLTLSSLKDSEEVSIPFLGTEVPVLCAG